YSISVSLSLLSLHLSLFYLCLLLFSKCDVPVIMLPMSLNWRYLWKLIADDQEWFNEQGGWRQLQPQADEIDEEDEKLDAKEPVCLSYLISLSLVSHSTSLLSLSLFTISLSLSL